jgi:diguanylate cyclase
MTRGGSISNTPPPGPDRARVQALLDQAQQHWSDDDFAASVAAAEQAVALAETGGWADLQASGCCLAADSLLLLGQAVPAMRHAITAKSLCLRAGLHESLAQAQVCVARICSHIGDQEQALVELDQAWQVIAVSPDAVTRIRAQRLFALCYLCLLDFTKAHEWAELAAQTAKASGRLDEQARCATLILGAWCDEGNDARDRGDAAQARAAWQAAVARSEAALHLSSALGERTTQVATLINLATALLGLGEHEPAARHLDVAAAIRATGVDNPLLDVEWAELRAGLMLEEGELDEAEPLLARAAHIGEQAGLVAHFAGLYKVWSTVAERRGDTASALARFKRFHELHEAARTDRARLRSQVLAVRHETERAQAEAQQAQQHAQALAQANQQLESDAVVLREQALLDPLTGVANRRRLDRELALRFDKAVSSGLPLCVALLDIDHFKQVNDGFSHAVGDEVLRRLALILRGQCREHDLVARYGGEEFVLIFGHVGQRPALQACERIRTAVQRHAWSELQPGLAITISVGLTEISGHVDAAAGLRAADALLYRAKAAGRNCVVSDGD